MGPESESKNVTYSTIIPEDPRTVTVIMKGPSKTTSFTFDGVHMGDMSLGMESQDITTQNDFIASLNRNNNTFTMELSFNESKIETYPNKKTMAEIDAENINNVDTEAGNTIYLIPKPTDKPVKVVFENNGYIKTV